uniref:Uncharacterized protein n=2 Tax=Caenorhabditis japonica TaxID=281687 RepID=A0A8R1HVK1_CAEJA
MNPMKNAGKTVPQPCKGAELVPLFFSFPDWSGPPIFLTQRSTDDVLILRMALEFGPRTCLVTNDRYTDHRSLVCQTDENLQRIWDEFLVDAVHRHNFHNIEPRRDYNLRIRRLDSDSDGDSTWILPVVTIKNDQYQIRSMQFYKIQKRK